MNKKDNIKDLLDIMINMVDIDTVYKFDEFMKEVSKNELKKKGELKWKVNKNYEKRKQFRKKNKY